MPIVDEITSSLKEVEELLNSQSHQLDNTGQLTALFNTKRVFRREGRNTKTTKLFYI